MIQEEFRPILEELEAGRSAVLHRTVDGVEYTRLFRPRERLILLGGGHIAQPLCRMAAMQDFDVTVVDDRTAYAAAPEYGTDIDDPAVTTLEHSAPKGPGQAERCHEFEIHVQHEGLIAYLLQGSGRTAAAVVNKDVCLAKVRKHSLYCSVELLS